MCFYRSRDLEFRQYFESEDDLVFCTDVAVLLLDMGVSEYHPGDWRLFLDSSMKSLKCVLLHNSGAFSAVPIGYSAKLKEDYKAIRFVLQSVQYEMHQ